MKLEVAILLFVFVQFAQKASGEAAECAERDKRAAALPNPNEAPRTIAKAIDQQVLATGVAPTKQFGFLYLHDEKMSDAPTYDLDLVKETLVTKTKKLPNLNSVCFWPSDSTTTNLLVAAPTFPDRRDRHSEFKLSEQMENMRVGFQERHEQRCPTYVIMGTRIAPCSSFKEPDGTQRDRCVQTYIIYKRRFRRFCRCTRFFLYARVPDSDSKTWQRRIKTLANNDITVLT